MEDFVSINVNTGRSRTNSLINRKMIFRILGILLFMEAAMFLVCASVSWYYREKEYIYFIYSILINVGVGGVLLLLGRNAPNMVTRRDGYCIVAFTWLLFTAFGMLPFYLSARYLPLRMLFSKRCLVSLQLELRYWTILKRFLMECFSGEVLRSGLADWVLCSLP